MPVVVYLDETGSPNLKRIDPHYPIFAVILCIIDQEEYISRLCPAVQRLKFRYFRSDTPVLHSYEIKKASGVFTLLKERAIRKCFLRDTEAIMRDHDYQLIAVAIRTQEHLNRYRAAAYGPYNLALEWALERLLPLLEGLNQTSIHIIAEKRGKAEDRELWSVFDTFRTQGNKYIELSRVRAVSWTMEFVPKSANVIGMQIADLAASPIGMRVKHHGDNLRYGTPCSSFWEVIRSKEYHGPGAVRGFKVFP